MLSPKSIPLWPRLSDTLSFRDAATRFFENIRRSKTAGFLLDPFAPSLNQDHQQNDADDTRDNSNQTDVIHFFIPFIPELIQKYCLKASPIKIADGPMVTRKIDGKINNTSGKTSLTVVLAACSSADCRLFVRRVSE